MTGVVLDDHLLRDVLAQRVSPGLGARLSGAVATTNLYYLRLCRSARRPASAGALLGTWTENERAALARVLVELPPEIGTVPLRDIGWQVADLATRYGLSTLGAEAVAASATLEAALCVWEGDDGPRIRRAAGAEGVAYETVARG